MKYREIKSLDSEDQAAAISLLKRRGHLEDHPRPWPPPGCLWCGHLEADKKTDENGIDHCPTCEHTLPP